MGTLEKSEHLRAISEAETNADWDDLDWQVAFDERAAILEYDEGLPRVEAAKLARQQIDAMRRRSEREE